jgi:hypothetical protein
MGMACSAKVPCHREHGLQRQGKDDIAPRTAKGRTSRMKHWKGPKCKIGIMDPNARRQLRLKIERTSDEFDRKAFRLKFVKRATKISMGCER